MAIEKLTMERIREMTDAEVKAKITEMTREGAALRFKQGTEVLTNPMDLRAARRLVARLQTVLAERAKKAS